MKMRNLKKNLCLSVTLALLITFLGCQNEGYKSYEIEYFVSLKPNTQNPLIVAFGDSFTSGHAVKKEFSYPGLLQKRLDALGCKYEVLNLGFNGDTAEKAFRRLDFVLELPSIEVFILELGANDLEKSAPIAEIKQNLQTIISRVKKKNIRVILCGYKVLSAKDLKYNEEAEKMYSDLAKENDLELIPSFLDNVASEKSLMNQDKIHPNEMGIEIIERNVFEKIKPHLDCRY
jgi:acyl-CoA thioesterase I